MLTIQPYQPYDLEPTVELWYRTRCQTFPHLQHPQPYSQWQQCFQAYASNSTNIIIAEIDNRILGFMVVKLPERELQQIFIDPNYQNQGIGSILVNKAKEICPQELKLTVLQQNQKACRFYEKHGFIAGKLSINKVNGQPCIEYSWFPQDIKTVG
jgi:putative acetyltransferase